MRCISCKGELVLADDIKKLCKRIYLLDDRCGLADIYLKQLHAEAKERGMGSISCLSPLCPDRFDALLLPERGVGFVSASAMDIAEPYRPCAARCADTDRDHAKSTERAEAPR